MGSMPNTTNPLSKTQWAAIDKRVRKVDEDRWISSRYAPSAQRRALTALYALAYELARVRLAVSEETLGLIRFQWWREALTELEEGKPAREHDVCLALAASLFNHLVRWSWEILMTLQRESQAEDLIGIPSV